MDVTANPWEVGGHDPYMPRGGLDLREGSPERQAYIRLLGPGAPGVGRADGFEGPSNERAVEANRALEWAFLNGFLGSRVRSEFNGRATEFEALMFRAAMRKDPLARSIWQGFRASQGVVPRLSITRPVGEIHSGEPQTFVAQVENCDADPNGFIWKVEGRPVEGATRQTATITFGSPGRKILAVQNLACGGLTGRLTLEVLRAAEPPAAGAPEINGPAAARVGEEVTFHARLVGGPGGDARFEFVASPGDQAPVRSDDTSAVFVWDEPGDKIVSATLTGPDRRTATAHVLITERPAGGGEPEDPIGEIRALLGVIAARIAEIDEKVDELHAKLVGS